MTLTSLTFTGGLLLGLASSVHCLGMCGGIASALYLPLAGEARVAKRLAGLLTIQAGRVLAYAAMGALVAALGGSVLGHFDHPTLYLALRTAAALALGWVGLTLIGIAPGFAPLDRAFLAISEAIARLARHVRRGGLIAPLLGGVGWGFVPCGMVYATLVFALAAGSARGGAVVMAGFGLGTVPAVAAAALGVASLRRIAPGRAGQVALGAALIGLAGASVLVPVETIARLCGAA